MLQSRAAHLCGAALVLRRNATVICCYRGPGEALMLGVQIGKLKVVAAYDIPAPLLHTYVVVFGSTKRQAPPSRNSKHVSGSRMRSPFCSP